MSRSLPIHVGADADEAAARGRAHDRRVAPRRDRRTGPRVGRVQRRHHTVGDAASSSRRQGRLGARRRVPGRRAGRARRRSRSQRDPHRVVARAARARSRQPRWHPIPVEEPDPAGAARRYERTLRDATAGVLDVVHLGLGDDGHTASLVPGDPVLGVTDRLVAPTGAVPGPPPGHAHLPGAQRGAQHRVARRGRGQGRDAAPARRRRPDDPRRAGCSRTGPWSSATRPRRRPSSTSGNFAGRQRHRAG